jgi:hypothetical protein
MIQRRTTTTDLRTIRANMDKTDAELGAMLGRTAASVKKLRLRYGIIKGKRPTLSNLILGGPGRPENLKHYKKAA